MSIERWNVCKHVKMDSTDMMPTHRTPSSGNVCSLYLVPVEVCLNRLFFPLLRVYFLGEGVVVCVGSYLVDPASSHMLVSKIKPCMSQYKCFTAKLRMAH